jgi:hypothetical protein
MPLMRRLWLLPVAVAVAGALAAAGYPAADVHGSVATGPRGLAHVPAVVLPFRPSLAWGPGRHGVVLIVHPAKPCVVRLQSVASTAPGRVDVTAQQVGTHCTGPRQTARFALPLPTLPDPRRNVRVNLGAQSLRLPWSKHVPPHPPGSLDL